MIRKAVKAGCELVILLLAAYAFFYLPVGRKTPFEHLRAIMATPEAKEAVTDAQAAGQEMKEKVVDAIRTSE
jgi:hypothetical protein